jgi:alpha-beta hydrolase superfamily lysophospholipase
VDALSLAGDRLCFSHHAPAREGGVTFVLFNALTQPLQAWDPVVEAVRERGHGSLAFDLRGQPGSTAAPGLTLDVARIVADAGALLAHVAAPRPVLVGLSIGGLFAVRTLLAGAGAEALVLVNTLRAPGPRLRWINHAVLRAAELGGTALVRDLYTPLLAGDAMRDATWPQAFPDEGYVPLDR